ncbi:hypothetical protein AMECASPLE_020289 [Ameca splendens]|uniref:Uncharacterized protein n=1 Tax=Ameca splendens TaxID=208324 RepID=A0ABV0YQ58_9TELE
MVPAASRTGQPEESPPGFQLTVNQVVADEYTAAVYSSATTNQRTFHLQIFQDRNLQEQIPRLPEVCSKVLLQISPKCFPGHRGHLQHQSLELPLTISSEVPPSSEME